MNAVVDGRPRIRGLSPGANCTEEIDMFLRWIGDLTATVSVLHNDGDDIGGPEVCADRITALHVAIGELVRTARAHAGAMIKRETEEAYVKYHEEQAKALAKRQKQAAP